MLGRKMPSTVWATQPEKPLALDARFGLGDRMLGAPPWLASDFEKGDDFCFEFFVVYSSGCR